MAAGGITLLVIAFAWLWHTTASPSTSELLVLDRAMTSTWPSSSPSEQLVEETLPDSWNSKDREGGRRYLLTFEQSGTSNADWGIYIPRIGNRFHVSLNGQLLAPYGPLAPSNIDYAQQPHLVLIPAPAIHAGINEIEIIVYGEKARYAGLSRIHLGPIHAARNAFYSRETLQTRGSFAVISLSILFGLVATPVALRLRDRATTLFAATCWLSALRSSYFVVAQPPLPYTWWSFVTDSAYLAYLVCLAEFCIEIIGTRRQLTRAATTAILLFTLVLLPLHAFDRLHWARQAWLAGMMIYSFFILTWVLQAWLRTRKDEATAIAIAGLLTVLLGVYDHLLVFYATRHGLDGYGSFTLTRYSLLLFILTMGWVLFTRYHKQQKELSDAKSHFEFELAKHRRDLDAAFDRQQISSSDSIRHTERDRIMLDIHDGLGLQLQSLLAQVEESPHPKELAQEVRIAIDQMRMLVSNTEQFNEDLTLVLGEIRYQLGRRLRQSRIKFSWQAPRITEKIFFSNERCVALQRWFFELTTNVIRHAQAQEVCVKISIDVHLQPHRLQICFTDDDDGYDVSAIPTGQGMRSLKIRAKDMQGVMASDGRPGTGAITQLSVPL